ADAHQQVIRFLRRFSGERRLFPRPCAYLPGKKRAARFPLFPLPFLPARPILRRPAIWRGAMFLARSCAFLRLPKAFHRQARAEAEAAGKGVVAVGYLPY